MFQKIKTKVLIISVILFITLAGFMPQVSALTWSTGVPLVESTVSEYSPAMTQTADGRIWLLWHKDAGSGKTQIFYKVYNGTWSGETQLTTDVSSNVNPAIVQSQDGKIWVFWSSDRMGPAGNWEIYYRTSSNNGMSWGADTRLTIDASYDKRPSVIQTHDGKIWVVWFSNRSGNDDLFYTTYDGSWTSFGVQLTTDVSNDQAASIVQSQDGKIWVFWSSYRTGAYQLWYKTTTDGGVSWSAETQLTSGGKWDEAPSAIQAKNGKIWVTWQRDTGRDYDIFYKTFDGVSWSDDTGLVTDNADDLLSSIYQTANTTIWVSWSTSINGDFDIYYIKTLADYDVAVKTVTCDSALAYKGYNRQFQVKVKNEGLLSASFSVTAYYNSTPVGTQSVTSLASNAETVLTFVWNTTAAAFGHYVLSATASGLVGEEDLTDNSLNGPVVLLTVAGDVNGDRSVNVVDGAAVSAHWYPGPPVGPLGYSAVCDVNGDGKVDIIDSSIVSARWGQSW